jgi:hypothetical protein
VAEGPPRDFTRNKVGVTLEKSDDPKDFVGRTQTTGALKGADSEWPDRPLDVRRAIRRPVSRSLR